MHNTSRSRDGLFRRRQVLRSGAACLAGALVWTTHGLTAPLLPTPPQTVGPFYPNVLPLDTDNDLVTIQGSAASAVGQITHVFGRMTDVDGRPVRNARVEIWQCDAFGRYIHTRDAGRGRRDGNFQGYGQTVTDADGQYRFRTIKPVAYSGRAPHIHFAIHGHGFARLTTQMYIAGAPENADDFLLNSIQNTAARQALIVTLQPRPELEPEALGGQFNIVLGNS
jgi:protocatechuate 3,4-dioxygenase beta subunit